MKYSHASVCVRSNNIVWLMSASTKTLHTRGAKLEPIPVNLPGCGYSKGIIFWYTIVLLFSPNNKSHIKQTFRGKNGMCLLALVGLIII